MKSKSQNKGCGLVPHCGVSQNGNKHIFNEVSNYSQANKTKDSTLIKTRTFTTNISIDFIESVINISYEML